MVPLYQEPKNTPFKPNIQKDIETDKYKKPPAQINQTVITQPVQEVDGKTFMAPPLAQPAPRAQQRPLVDLQIYEPAKPPAPKKTVDPALFVPAGMPTSSMMYPPQWQPNVYAAPGTPGIPGLSMPYSMIPNNIPLLKNYNINIAGPSVDHMRVSAIYEDILPSKHFLNTANTCGERLNIYQFTRSVFVKHDDGENVDLDGNTDSSLLRCLKFLELNPYNTNQLSDNPYKGLPDDMLIYRSCYPIRYDSTNHTTQCANNPIGMNIRIYKITIGEYNLKKNKEYDYYNYDVWREIAYYEYIREKIIKTKQCPNFPIMYAYFICENCRIDFDKLKRIKGGKSVVNEPRFIAKVDYTQQDPTKQVPDDAIKSLIDVLNDDDEPPKYKPISLFGGANGYKSVLPIRNEPLQGGIKYVTNNHPLPPPIEGYVQQQNLKKFVNDVECINKGTCGPNVRASIELNMAANSGKAIVALTEAPTYNLYGWASKTYRVDGNLRRMINTGFHKSEVWYSVFFQLFAALYTLQVHKIAFRDFTIMDNVYIKDTKISDNVTNYWKYVIDGVEYYVPNYGYLVMIDSNYKDKEKDNLTLIQSGSNNKNFRLYSNIYEADGGALWNETQLNDLCFKALENCINPNNFSTTFTNGGGIKPPDDFMKFLDNSLKNINGNNKDIGNFILSSMGIFMNNRIGTILKEDEVTNVRVDDKTPFTKGQIVVHQFQNATYRFVLFLSSDATNKSEVLAKTEPVRWDHTGRDDMNIIKQTVPTDSLFNYSKYTSIEQSYKPNKVFNEDKLLEIYVINKN